jgi:ribosomal protein L16 Arg81 hydroxylase
MGLAPSAPATAPTDRSGGEPVHPLAWLLDPFDLQQFLDEYYEKKPLVVRRQTPGYFRELLSLADLDNVLGTHGIRHPDLNIVSFGKDIPHAEYTVADNEVDPRKAALLFAGGATLVFSQLHTRVPALGELCLALNRALSSRMQTNIYLTPVSSQGFAPHWDTHDTIILQVEGTKDWTIYDTKIELPLRGQGFNVRNPEHQAGAPSMEFQMHPGDTLYIPRGLMHAARATETLSLHITVGVIAYTWADLLIEAVATAAANDPRLRENLPFGFDSPEFPAEAWRALFDQKWSQLAAGLGGGRAAAETFAASLSRQNKDLPRNLIQQVAESRGVKAESRVRARRDVVWQYEEGEKECALVGGERRVSFPRFAAPALRYVAGNATFTPAQLPDCLDEDGKLTLVRRLLREGLLECVETRTAD